MRAPVAPWSPGGIDVVATHAIPATSLVGKPGTLFGVWRSAPGPSEWVGLADTSRNIGIGYNTAGTSWFLIAGGVQINEPYFPGAVVLGGSWDASGAMRLATHRGTTTSGSGGAPYSTLATSLSLGVNASRGIYIPAAMTLAQLTAVAKALAEAYGIT